MTARRDADLVSTTGNKIMAIISTLKRMLLQHDELSTCGEITSIRITTRSSFIVCFFIIVFFCVTTICHALQNWSLAPQLILSGVLLWHTRHDIYAVLPGFLLGFIIGIITSAGIGPASGISCGIFCGTIGVPINVICRGFWRSGIMALFVIITYWIVVQIILLSHWNS